MIVQVREKVKRPEGVVAFTTEPLHNNRGQRLMFKLKSEDFA